MRKIDLMAIFDMFAHRVHRRDDKILDDIAYLSIRCSDASDTRIVYHILLVETNDFITWQFTSIQSIGYQRGFPVCMLHPIDPMTEKLIWIHAVQREKW